MEKIDTLVVDKVGTLTEGRPKVVAEVPTNEYSGATVLRRAASVERASEHPLADAIVSAARDRSIQTTDVKDFDSPVGKGPLGTVEGNEVLLGNATFLYSRGVDTSSLEAEAERQRGEGATVINMAIDGSLAGILAIADPVKQPTARGAARTSRQRGQGHHAHRRQSDDRSGGGAEAWYPACGSRGSA
ncbi:cation transport ATPase [Bradyrhizobium sp. USDA 4011]|jgi:Cu+-exporting ATPase